jgi:hypothetical protein
MATKNNAYEASTVPTWNVQTTGNGATKSDPYGDGKHRGVKTMARRPRVKTAIKASDVGRAIGLALNDHYNQRIPHTVAQSDLPVNAVFTAVIKRVLEIAPNIDEEKFCAAVDDAYWEDR